MVVDLVTVCCGFIVSIAARLRNVSSKAVFAENWSGNPSGARSTSRGGIELRHTVLGVASTLQMLVEMSLDTFDVHLCRYRFRW